MATCPKCGHNLKPWDVKAECPKCNVNIPNYKWEERLNRDAENAAIAWENFRKFTGNFKSALFGSKLRILRFVFTFVPLILLVLPLAEYTVDLPFVSHEANFTLLGFSMNTLLSLNWGSISNLVSSDFLGTAVLLLICAVLLTYLAVVFGVLNFVFILLKAPKLKANINIAMCIASTLCFVFSAIFFCIAISSIASTTIVFISGSLQYGAFIGIGLFALNTIINTAVGNGFKKQLKES